jgi:hypothetical protein
MTCRVLMLQLLRTSHGAISERLGRVDEYAAVFERVIVPQLSSIDELVRLRERLKDHQQLMRARGLLEIAAASALGPNDWTAASRAIVDLLSQANAESASAIGRGQIVQRDGAWVVREDNGRTWTLDDIEKAIVVRRGVVESIDPLAKQIIDVPEAMDRFREHPTAVRAEVEAMLREMLANNNEITREVEGAWAYAFRASKISHELPTATIPGTSFALQGVHLLCHQEIGEFFRGDWSYASGVDSLFGAELGLTSLISFFTFTGLVLLAVVCAPAALVAGAAVAGYEYSEALEQEQIYESLLDPELMLSRAEVEAELFAAQLGLALSFIPEAGTVLRVGARGATTAVRAGIRSTARSLAAGARRATLRGLTAAAGRAITREMAASLKQGLVVAFVREITSDQAMDSVLSAILEPVLRHVQREALITGPAGGVGGVEATLRFLEDERRRAGEQ